MHLVYVLLPVGPPFSTGVEREYDHGCGWLARRQRTSILFPFRATTPEGIQGMACGPETHVVTVSPTFSFQSLSEIWLQA